MNKLSYLAAACAPVNNSLENTWHTICSDEIRPLELFIWMILLIGMALPEFALANCEGTGPCYCTPGTSVCTNTPPSGNSSGGSGGSGSTSQDQMLIQGAGILGNAIGEALRGNPEENAKRQAEADRAAALQRQAEEQRKAEEMRKQEAAKQRILGSLKGAEPSTGLALKMGDSDPTLTGHELQLKLGDTSHQKPISDAYNKGFKDGSECYAQSAGPYCSGLSGNEWQSCLDDYRSGYQVGDKQREMAMQEAYQAGQRAGAIGGVANGASDSLAGGACRTQWIEIYNRGYSQSKSKTVQH